MQTNPPDSNEVFSPQPYESLSSNEVELTEDFPTALASEKLALSSGSEDPRISALLKKSKAEKFNPSRTSPLNLMQPNVSFSSLPEIEFLQRGNCLFLNEKSPPPPSHKKIPAGTYMVRFHPMQGYYLEGTKNFYESGKVYGNLGQYTDRILNTYAVKAGNTGVILAGTKGSGKTKLARLVCEKAVSKGLPVLIVNSPFSGDSWLQFLNQIEQECVILLDEFEKVYDQEDQSKLLTLLDGVFISKKLFLLTCNDKYKIDSHFRNRPGRIHYLIDFEGMDRDSIKEYCQENVKDPERAKSVIKVSSLYCNLSFDVLKALVWEVNAYPDSSLSSILSILNARSDGGKDGAQYSTKISHELVGELENFAGTRSVTFNPLVEKVYSLRIQFSREQALQFIEKIEGFGSTFAYSLSGLATNDEDERDEFMDYLEDFKKEQGAFSKRKIRKDTGYYIQDQFNSKNISGMDEATGEFICKTDLFGFEVRLSQQIIQDRAYWYSW